VDEVAVGQRLGTGRIEHQAGRPGGRIDADPGHVLHVDRLDRVPTQARQPVDRESAKRPGEVVDEDVARAVGERRADDDPLEARALHHGFQSRLGADVGRVGIERGVDDAHVHHPTYAGFSSRG
jgi:hypothetical protein